MATSDRRAFGIFGLVVLALLLPTLHASTVTAGPWQFDSSFKDSDALALMANLTFSPTPTPPDNAWQVKSNTLLLMDSQNNLVQMLVLAPSCPPIPQTSCADHADIYRSQDGQIIRLGKLSFKSSNLFQPPTVSLPSIPNPAPAAGSSPASPSGVSPTGTPPSPDSPPAPQVPFISGALPSWWLSALTLLIVTAITVAYALRQRY